MLLFWSLNLISAAEHSELSLNREDNDCFTSALESSTDLLQKVWKIKDIPQELILPNTIEKLSVSELEVDAHVNDVTNKSLLSGMF